MCSVLESDIFFYASLDIYMKKYTNAFADQLYERKIFSCHPLCMKDEIILTKSTYLMKLI